MPLFHYSDAAAFISYSWIHIQVIASSLTSSMCAHLSVWNKLKVIMQLRLYPCLASRAHGTNETARETSTFSVTYYDTAGKMWNNHRSTWKKLNSSMTV